MDGRNMYKCDDSERYMESTLGLTCFYVMCKFGIGSGSRSTDMLLRVAYNFGIKVTRM